MTFDADRLVRAFDEAELHADTEALDALLADDFRSIGDQGRVLDKQQWLGKFAGFAYLSLTSSDVEVCRYDGAAIVRLVQRSESTWQGHRMALTVRAGQTWVRQDGGWPASSSAR
ncbi:hypothetical protein BJY16_006163 [Actinoplanes octamycinicus]|uniref:DUF4440 domain-containing protein n=1 Tax=Actinoplanes octamycinicus TaxID=135948 RepID=A0A7W7H2D2_9ACTN|nr:nuclear transport factor 2 family protein [Actinoplanes octamycinicus]MBB4742704.1 hypothetical protein [Actinoplanes octamycinicus]GIE63005.1 hypothetical protein Aoc01nite_84070 [Actinoplanes octamycinicus]